MASCPAHCTCEKEIVSFSLQEDFYAFESFSVSLSSVFAAEWEKWLFSFLKVRDFQEQDLVPVAVTLLGRSSSFLFDANGPL